MDLTNSDDIQSEPTFPQLIQNKWKERAGTWLKLYENVYPAPCRSNDYAVHQEQAPHISARPPHTTPPAAQVLKTRS